MKRELEKQPEQKRSGKIACWFNIAMSSLVIILLMAVSVPVLKYSPAILFIIIACLIIEAGIGLYYNIKYICTGKSKFGAAAWGSNPFGLVCITKVKESQTILNEEELKAIERGRKKIKIGLWLLLLFWLGLPLFIASILEIIGLVEMWAPLRKYTRTLKGKE